MDFSTLNIGEVSRQSGCSASALRYYEQAGLISPLARTPTVRRMYPPSVLHTLHVIKALREAGFSVQQVRLVLASKVSGESQGQRLERLCSALDDLEARLGEKRDALARAEALLHDWRTQLTELL